MEQVDNKAALINMDQSKAFDVVDHCFWRQIMLPGTIASAKYCAYVDDMIMLVRSNAEIDEVG